ncbi:MAG: flagellar hook-associated protein FlgK, partial [Lachnospiraceae bacterium]|nr:flagellar hook-associated protein FlgK [Lachnospiraceae bacterium]
MRTNRRAVKQVGRCADEQAGKQPDEWTDSRAARQGGKNMPGTFFGMNIARSGMLTYNTWLNTTGHNIANIRTEGYSRQTVNQEATVPIKMGTSYGMMGSGVDAISIESQRDIYYDEKYRMSNSEYGKYETASTFMKDIEDLLYAKTTDSGAITNSMNNFLQRMSGWTTDSESASVRKEVVGYADLLMQNINEAADRLKEIQKDVNSQIADTVDQINAYAQEIASLTQQINTLEVYGTKACDLRDQRAYILDKLSELADINVNDREAKENEGVNQYIVSVDNAILVDTYNVNLLRYEARDTYNALDDIDSLYDLRWSTGQDFGIHDTALGGKLQALFELRDGNNGEIFTGKTSVKKGDVKVVVTDVNELGSNLFKLQIPEQNGVLTVDHAEYEYKYFECEVDENGTYEYTFYLKDGTSVARDLSDVNAKVSDAVDFRGIPYYQSQLNEFVRTFAYYFNEQHMQ